ncbi:MAG TPA: efflux RND transporter periplasmic adaptor subunit [Steroidobacteraceae bacterium]|nr:efflux RND transporter periplasmic adaptor subunit [Steroidobacteraceae bacterium]
MNRRFLLPVAAIAIVLTLALTAALALRPAHADASGAAKPSVLVTLAPLKRGSLPHVVIGYGTVVPASSGRKMVMAPVSAVVGTVDVRLGQQVPKGAPLMRLDPSPTTAASYDQARSALAVAKHLVQSTRKLMVLHLATQQQLANAQKSESDARAALVALNAVGAGGERIVRAPFSAIVTTLTARPGEIVSAGTPLLDLAAPGHLVLTVGVVPAQAAEVNADDPAKVTLVGGTRPVAGRVLLRGAVAEADTGLVPVEISLPPGSLLPGEMAEAAITTRAMEGYVVPHKALLVDEKGSPYVVQAANGIAHKVPVRVLDANGARDVITGALDPRAWLVLTGNYQLDNGMRIRLADPKQGGGGN